MFKKQFNWQKLFWIKILIKLTNKSSPEDVSSICNRFWDLKCFQSMIFWKILPGSPQCVFEHQNFPLPKPLPYYLKDPETIKFWCSNTHYIPLSNLSQCQSIFYSIFAIFSFNNYKSLLPSHWKVFSCKRTSTIGQSNTTRHFKQKSLFVKTFKLMKENKK